MEDRSRGIVAAVYAKPIFELACEDGLLDEVRGELKALTDLLRENREFVSLLESPFVQIEQRVSLLKKVFQGKLSSISLGLLEAVLKRKRLSYIADIAEQYERFYCGHKGINLVDVTVASAMSNEAIGKLSEKLSKAAGGPVRMDVKIDPSILGGIVIEQGDIIIDNSLRKALQEARNAISRRVG